MEINGRKIGEGSPAYIIAEMSANHAGDMNRALEIIHAAKEAGADCVKIQTYTPDTITLKCDNPYFTIESGTWEKQNLYELYGKAYTPWEWQPRLMEEAKKLGIEFFSTPFDLTAVKFLEDMGVASYKIASFEVTDIPLIKAVAKTGKPIIMSVGMATKEEVDEAVKTVRDCGNDSLALLKCSSVYPAIPDDMNLRMIPKLKEMYSLPAGLSDHSMGHTAALTAVAIGADIIEKHFCISREIENPDASFSMEADEFAEMVKAIRDAERALGKPEFSLSEAEKNSRKLRKSIFVSADIKKGDVLSTENIRVVRPGAGLHPRYYEKLLGLKASRDIAFGTPFEADMAEGFSE
jgi:pseudaminic acid synthase